MPTRCDGAGGSGDVGTEGRHEIGLGRGVRVSQRPSSAVRSRGWRGAQAARWLGKRREPAPSWQRGKKSRRAATTRAAAATSARKVDMIAGCGAVCAHRRGRAASWCHGATEARKRRASSARGTSRRRCLIKDKKRRSAATARPATAASARKVDELSGGGAVMGIAEQAR